MPPSDKCLPWQCGVLWLPCCLVAFAGNCTNSRLRCVRVASILLGLFHHFLARKVVLVEVFVSGAMLAHILYVHSCRLKDQHGLSSYLIVVKKSTNTVNMMFSEICNSSMDIACGVQHKTGRNFFSFNSEMKRSP